MVPLWTTATITAEQGLPSADAATYPLAILSIDLDSEGLRIFHQMYANSPDVVPEIRAEVWVELPGQKRSSYSRDHATHPLIRLWVGRTREGVLSPRRELCFLVCVRCESSFMNQCTSDSQNLGLMIAPRDDLDESADNVPPIVLADMGPAEFAYVELHAWRHAYD